MDQIFALFEQAGSTAYFGEQVSQLEHALQAAWQAEREGAPATLVTAGLLHDVGHLFHNIGEDHALRGIDDYHENLGADWLEERFGLEVSEPVRLHVEAKRYLCAVQPGYRSSLSPASRLTLELQGGAMTDLEVAAFKANPFSRDALRLRRWDDGAKVEALATPDLLHFRPHVLAALRRRPVTMVDRFERFQMAI